MTSPLVISPEAEQDLAQGYDWYEERRSGLGKEFLLAVQDALDRIAQFPEIHAATYKNVRQTLVKKLPYVICYTYENERIYVLAVFHGHRDPQQWQSRVP